MSLLHKLTEQKLTTPPKWLPDNCCYLTIMGSEAYGVSSDDSDWDIYGFAIPHKEDVFPHLRGEIPGFGKQAARFEVYQQHHVHDPSQRGGKGRTYDFAVYSIVRYLHLCMEGNPNMVDSLFTPASCVIHSTQVGNMVRDYRRLFLSKQCWPKLKGYSYSQLHKMSVKQPQEGSKRYADVQEHGFDRKFGYHVVRLLLEAEQILTTGDLDLQRDREQLKAIRRGEWTEEDIRDFFSAKEKQLEAALADSTLPAKPDEAAIKRLLLACLETHYGSLAGCVVQPDAAWEALRQIETLCASVREQAGLGAQHPLAAVAGTYGGPAWEELLETMRRNREEEMR